jgi:uncharacterized membrane protein YgdD (TMEM256/DUF423 family)
MHRSLIRVGAIGMAISISLGALGAHQLKKMLSATSLEIFHTGVDYLLYHSLAFLILAALIQFIDIKRLLLAARMFLAGMILFSGSLFAICILQYNSVDIPMWLGILTPIGGVCFIVGWAIVALAAFKKQTTNL